MNDYFVFKVQERVINSKKSIKQYILKGNVARRQVYLPSNVKCYKSCSKEVSKLIAERNFFLKTSCSKCFPRTK